MIPRANLFAMIPVHNIREVSYRSFGLFIYYITYPKPTPL